MLYRCQICGQPYHLDCHNAKSNIKSSKIGFLCRNCIVTNKKTEKPAKLSSKTIENPIFQNSLESENEEGISVDINFRNEENNRPSTGKSGRIIKSECETGIQFNNEQNNRPDQVVSIDDKPRIQQIKPKEKKLRQSSELENKKGVSNDAERVINHDNTPVIVIIEPTANQPNGRENSADIKPKTKNSNKYLANKSLENDFNSKNKKVMSNDHKSQREKINTPWSSRSYDSGLNLNNIKAKCKDMQRPQTANSQRVQQPNVNQFSVEEAQSELPWIKRSRKSLECSSMMNASVSTMSIGSNKSKEAEAIHKNPKQRSEHIAKILWVRRSELSLDPDGVLNFDKLRFDDPRHWDCVSHEDLKLKNSKTVSHLDRHTDGNNKVPPNCLHNVVSRDMALSKNEKSFLENSKPERVISHTKLRKNILEDPKICVRAFRAKENTKNERRMLETPNLESSKMSKVETNESRPRLGLIKRSSETIANSYTKLRVGDPKSKLKPKKENSIKIKKRSESTTKLTSNGSKSKLLSKKESLHKIKKTGESTIKLMSNESKSKLISKKENLSKIKTKNNSTRNLMSDESKTKLISKKESLNKVKSNNKINTNVVINEPHERLQSKSQGIIVDLSVYNQINVDSLKDNFSADPSAWDCDRVYTYFQQYFPNDAQIFKDEQIDGHSLLQMQRSDIIGLKLKLGIAINSKFPSEKCIEKVKNIFWGICLKNILLRCCK